MERRRCSYHRNYGQKVEKKDRTGEEIVKPILIFLVSVVKRRKGQYLGKQRIEYVCK